jgi:hypothetical protein
MFTEEEFIIAVFCLVEDEARPLLETKLRSRGFGPQLSDTEVLTIEIVGEFLGYHTDTAIWTYFRRHWLALFPALGSRTTFVRQAANLWAVKQRLHARLVRRLGAYEQDLFIVDGLPMPVCAFCRAPRVRCFRGEAAFGYCRSKKQRYFGFKGEVVITASGLIVAATAIAANADERDAVWELSEGVRGLLIGDKGFISQALAAQLERERGLRLETTGMRKNMTETRSQVRLRELSRIRKLVETVIGQLAERFQIERVHAHDRWHLTSRVARKILSHTVAVFFCRQAGDESLRFERLIAA